ncbi:MAG: glycoside hydrolase family 43 protein [Ignavibacteriae bacterium]|nr:glycoside hydrolase family 43 protein [Ignavibacteriota bacterium]
MKNILFITILFGVIYCSQPQVTKHFTNPILSGFYPDPSIERVGDDYYLITSTFSYFPGIPIFHSKDLVNWELIGHALENPNTFNTNGLGLSRGIFAPAINYHKGIFYITCTIVDGGGNFVVTSKNSQGPYSDPIYLPEINGIDPSLHFEDDGKAYILYNSDAPENKPLYSGHRTIRMYEFDIENLKVVGEEKILINGGTDLSKKPEWIEGPHIYKKYGYYYLMAAEGGTADNHSEVIFRSKNIWGPYESFKGNPILTQRTLDPKRKNPVTSTGHADMFETQNGEWWAIFLGIRPYEPFEKNYYNLARETFLTPVKWIEDPNSNGDMWPIINPDFTEVQFSYPYPNIDVDKKNNSIEYSGNFSRTYTFDENELHKNFIFLRTPLTKWFSLDEKKSYVALELREETCNGLGNPSFLGHRQHNNACVASTKLQFTPNSENEKAGLVIFTNENKHYFICKSLKENKEVIQLFKSVKTDDHNNGIMLIESREILDGNKSKDVIFRIDINGGDFSFSYSFDNENWNLLKDKVDGTYIRAHIPEDFVGSVFGLYATSLGKESNSKAYFDNFYYEGKDKIYIK